MKQKRSKIYLNKSPRNYIFWQGYFISYVAQHNNKGLYVMLPDYQ